MKIAIIPARGGSQRLPQKNIMPFRGRPMISWTIEAAADSGIFDDILVSTDSHEIADVARKWGAVVPFLRDPRYADAHTPVSIATINALGQMEKLKGYSYGTIVQLMPNCPLRTSADIINAYKYFEESETEFQISVFKFGWMNPWWSLERNPETGHPKPLFPEALKKRSQDLPDLFCPTGAIWVADAAKLKEQGSFYGQGYTTCPIGWMQAMDIDNQEDLEMANCIADFLNR